MAQGRAHGDPRRRPRAGCRPSQESLMSTAVKRRLVPTSTHWGTYWAEVEGDRLLAVHDYAGDPAPAIIGPGTVDAVTHDTRIGRPLVRKIGGASCRERVSK